MRPVKNITSEQENFRIEKDITKRNGIKPEPEGTIILMAFRLTGYDPDCDSSLMGKFDHIDKDGEHTGWSPNHLGVSPKTGLVITQKELTKLFEKPKRKKLSKFGQLYFGRTYK